MSNTAPATTVLTRWLVDYLEQHDLIELQELIVALGLPKNAPTKVLHHLALPQYLSLLNMAANRLGDDNLGLTLSGLTPDDAFGALGMMMRHTATLREYFQSLDRFGLLFSNAMGFAFIEDPISSRVEYRILLPTDEDPRQDNEYTLAVVALLIRRFVGQDWLALRVNFSHSRPEDTHAHDAVFGESVYFDQAVNSVVFDSSILSTEISDANPRLLTSLREHVERSLTNLKRQDNLISQVRFFIATTLSTSACSVENAARQLLTSKRSMTRHLEQLGTSFRAIRQDVLIEMSKSALAETNSSVIEIALHLGFSETSSFDRSFKKLTGQTPEQYRRSSQDRNPQL